VFQPDAEHIHHKLLKLGMSQRQAVLILYAVSAIFGLLSLSLLYSSGRDIAPVLVVIASGVFIGLQQLRYHEFRELKGFAVRTMNQKRIIANNVNIRRAAEALHRCASMADICSTLAECLEPIGFDGFTLWGDAFDYDWDEALVPLIRDENGELSLYWRDGDGDFASKFTLRLVSSEGERCGEFSVLRFAHDEPLWFDGQVFITSSFSEALADAVLRARRHAQSRDDWQDVNVLAREASASFGVTAQGD
jgi:hypothetical protein